MTLQISLKSDTSPNPPHTPPSLSLPKEDSSPQSNSDHEGSESGRTQNLDHAAAADSLVQEESGRERLKRHQMAVAGHVWIPEKWGKEELLKDWIDGSAFEASLFPSGVVSARLALVREGKRSNNNASADTLRILNRC